MLETLSQLKASVEPAAMPLKELLVKTEDYALRDRLSEILAAAGDAGRNAGLELARTAPEDVRLSVIQGLQTAKVDVSEFIKWVDTVARSSSTSRS